MNGLLDGPRGMPQICQFEALKEDLVQYNQLSIEVTNFDPCQVLREPIG